MSARSWTHRGPSSRHARQVSLESTSTSVYSTSLPSMSRASSGKALEILDTPSDEHPPTSVLVDKKQATHFDARVQEHDTYGDGRLAIRKNVSYNKFTGDSSLSESPVINQAKVSSALDYRRSTRELISKYEAISDRRGTPPSVPPARQSVVIPPISSSLQRRNSPLPEPPLPMKSKAQTTFSFRNILTVFGKKNKSPRHTHAETRIFDAKPRFLHTQDAFFTSSPRPEDALYLSSSTRPPAWRDCSLMLHSSHLTLTFSEDARRITHTIPLLYCVDVVSLAGYQLGRDIPTPPISGDTEPRNVAHVFEMTFEGCEPAKERLAAWSVAERGRWVSAIWDAILACRDPNTVQNDVRIESPASSRGPPLKVVNGTSVSRSSVSSPSPSAPQPVTSENTGVQGPLVPSSNVSVTTTPTRHIRRVLLPKLSSTPPSLPSSPSMQTLGSMSIVRQRLAKLDAQEQLPYVHSLSRGISDSGSYVASSIKRHTPRTDERGGQDRHAYTSTASDRLERSSPTAKKFNSDGAIQGTSFTALDAHAMYHEPPVDFVETETENLPVNIPSFGRVEQIRRNLRTDKSHGDSTDPTEGVQSLERDVHPLSTSFHEHATEQSSTASGVADRLTSLGTDVDTIVTNSKTLPRGSNEAEMVLMHTKLDEIKDEITALDARIVRTFFDEMTATSRSHGHFGPSTLANGIPSGEQPYSKPDLSPISTKLEELRNGLEENLPLILSKLKDLEAPSIISTDVAPALAKLENIMDVMNISPGSHSSPADLTNVHAKLDGLIALCTSLTNKPKDAMNDAPDDLVMHNVSHTKDRKETIEDRAENNITSKDSDGGGLIPGAEQVTKLLELLQDENISRETQAKQQADSVRYLNELNTWLENFVTNSVGNMQQVATGVDQLCKEWLPTAETQIETNPPDSKAKENEEPRGPVNTFASLRRFLEEQKEKSGEARDLQVAIQNLTETLKEDMTKNAEARFEMVRHAQVQESLLNGLAAEMTKEIRGERLRFVDAMKDATSVNVAVHVEEFKKVLGKLHHEKMVLEQQIAELFSFVAKQRQGHPPQPQPNRPTSEAPRPYPRPLPQITNQNLPSGYFVGSTPP